MLWSIIQIYYKMSDIVGFVEHDMQTIAVMEYVITKIKKIYTKYGFRPFDSRLVEDINVVKNKGIDTKELYTINYLSQGVEYKPNDNKTKLVLRFDLTLPLARYVGQHNQEINFPFKRYQIQKVYRGEHAKVAQGRYNEFIQSDIDVIGDTTLDILYDSELVVVISNIFKNVFMIDNFVVRISNRKLLEGLFCEYGVNEIAKIKQCIKIIDCIEKNEMEFTIEKLTEVGMTQENITKLLKFFDDISVMTPTLAVEYLRNNNFTNKNIIDGINELGTVVKNIIISGVEEKNFIIDPKIARGLDYYTGTIYETILPDFLELGSVCSGGRYDNLVSTLMKNKKYPGVGISIGLSRLVPKLVSVGHLKIPNKINIMVACQDKKYIDKYVEIGATLRNSGINTEIFMQKNKKLGFQLEFADKNNFKYVVIGNKYEFDNDEINIRNMLTKQTEKIKLENLVEYFMARL